MTEVLLGCPFCGAEPAIFDDRLVGCETCGSDSAIYSTRKHAIAAWNTRAPDPKVAALVEAERRRCYDIVMAARLSEIDTDFRTILHFIDGGRTIEKIKAALQAIEGEGK